METIYELRRKRSQYYNLKDNLYYAINNLNSAIDYITFVCDEYKKAYTIDSMSADNNRLENQKKKLLDKKTFITNVIIPRVNANIYSLDLKIQNMQGSK